MLTTSVLAASPPAKDSVIESPSDGREGSIAISDRGDLPAHADRQAACLQDEVVAGRVLAGRVRGGSGSAARTWLSNEKKSR